MTECIQSSFGFKGCGSREIVARFDGATISSDGGAWLPRETDKRLNLAGIVPAGLVEPALLTSPRYLANLHLVE
jgi:hypothetical protein